MSNSSPNNQSENNWLIKLFDTLHRWIYQKKEEKKSSRVILFSITRIVVLIFVLILGLQMLINTNTKVHSLQGFVNAEVFAVKAPIAGKLTLAHNLKPGQYLKSRETIGRIDNKYEEYISDLQIKRNEKVSQIQALNKHHLTLTKLVQQKANLRNNYQKEAKSQFYLRAQYEDQKLQKARNELAEAKEVKDLAHKDHQRLQALIDDGFVSQADVDQAHSDYEQAQAIYESKKALVGQNSLQKEASLQGVQVEGSQAVSFQQMQKSSLDQEILDLEQQKSELELQIALAETELKKIKQLLKAQKKVVIKVPNDGVVWSTTTKSNEIVSKNQTLLKLVDCRNRWVESFVPEKDLGDAYIGAPVKIRALNDQNKSWDGYIQSIRGGSNRIRLGEDLDLVPPELVRKQMAIRIEVDWQQSEEDIDFLSIHEFCMAGNSVEVSFQKRKSNNKARPNQNLE